MTSAANDGGRRLTMMLAFAIVLTLASSGIAGTRLEVQAGSSPGWASERQR